MADEANVGFQYLNPALSTSSRLFNELTKDTPLLERFLVDSSQLVTALAERRDDLAGLIGNLNDTTRALGNQKVALAESIGRLPPFMRRANTTFVNLRSPSTTSTRWSTPRSRWRSASGRSSRRPGPSPPTPSRPSATSA